MSGWRSLAPRLPSAALCLLGLAALYKASSLPFGTVRQPDSGFFPTLACVVLIVFAGASCASADHPPSTESASQPNGALRLWAVVVALALYAWAFVAVGFLLCTAALILLLLRGVGNVPLARSALVAVVAATVCYGLFTRLGVPLPAGILGF